MFKFENKDNFYLACIQYQRYQRNLVHMCKQSFLMAANQRLSKRHECRMVWSLCMDFCKHYWNRPIWTGNRHRLYIVALVQLELVYTLCMHRQHIQANICMWPRDCRHDIERLVRSCMDLGNVHWHRPNGMDNHGLLCILVVRKQPTDFHDNHSGNHNAHDDCNLIYRWHFFRTVFDRTLQRNCDLHTHELVDNHYPHGNQLKRNWKLL